MSNTATASSRKNKDGGADAKGTADTKAYMRDVDERLARLHRTILPETPYILTIPSDLPYNLHPSQRNDWRRDTPFGPHEEQLQYMSFLYREPGESLIVLRTEREMQRGYGRDKHLKPMNNGVMSGTATPLHSQAGKKKITLSAYKSKRADGDVKTPFGTEQTSSQGGAVQKPQVTSNGVAAGDPRVEETVNGVIKHAPHSADNVNGVTHDLEQHDAPRKVEVASKSLDDSENNIKKEALSKPRDTGGPVREVRKPSHLLVPSATKAQKRPLDSGSHSNNSQSPLHQPSSPPAKKQRTSPPAHGSSGMTTASSATHRTPKLPPLLAPVLGPLEPDRPQLPPLLSLGLGSPLETEVDLSHTRKVSGSKSTAPEERVPSVGQASTPTKNELKVTPKSKDKLLKEEKGVARQKATVPSPSLRGKQEIRTTAPKANGKPNTKTPSVPTVGTKRKNSDETESSSKTLQDKPANPAAAVETETQQIESRTERDQLIVKLKYGKSQSKAIQRILQLPPAKNKERGLVNPRKEAENPKELHSSSGVGTHDSDKRVEKDGDRDERRKDAAGSSTSKPSTTQAPQPGFNSKTIPKAKEALTPKTSGKGSRPADVDTSRETSAKKLKAGESLDIGKWPRTPITPALQSPFSAHAQSAQKANPSSLRKNLIPGHMERSDSSNGTVDTPTDITINGNTPTTAATVDRAVGAASNSTAAVSPERAAEVKALADEYRKYLSIGRRLKHGHKETAKKYDADELDEAGIKSFAVSGVEVILCFMLAFSIQDRIDCLQHRPDRASGGWRSNLELIDYIRARCRKVPQLEGLCAQLESVIFHRILALEPLQLQLERAGNSKDFRVKVDNDGANTYAMEGEKRLPLTTIMSAYPRTWQKRSLNPPMEAELKADKLSGEFFLPLHSILTTPMQGVRMGVSLLKEYADREKVHFQPTIVL